MPLGQTWGKSVGQQLVPSPTQTLKLAGQHRPFVQTVPEQTHWPPWHTKSRAAFDGSLGQILPQEPQLLRSVRTSTHCTSPATVQRANGLSQGTHCALRHSSVTPHCLPQAPQLLRSLTTLTQRSSQQSVPPPQRGSHSPFFRSFLRFFFFFFRFASATKGSRTSAPAKARLASERVRERRGQDRASERRNWSKRSPSIGAPPRWRGCRDVRHV